MNLFKRVLLSFFPEEIVNQQINPASMFVSLISAKQFFSVINRKIVENYKINLFDISLDPFEVKIGFGDNPTIKVKDVDFYYSYASVANFNGYRFLNPSNIATSMSLITSVFTHKTFSAYQPIYFLHFLFCVYLMTFIFASKIKVFPYADKEQNYKRFIDVFFNFYELIFEQSGKKFDQNTITEIKKELVKNLEVFFTLFYVYQRVNKLFVADNLTDKDFYSRLFYDELKKGSYKNLVQDYVENSSTYSSSSLFSLTEKKIINLILPADILIRYLLDGKDIFMICQILIEEIYPPEKFAPYLTSFLKNDDLFEEFLLMITDYEHFKQSFFSGMRKLMQLKFRNNFGGIDEEIDDFMSSIGKLEDIDEKIIPERLRQESQMMEKMINFYVTCIGGFWIARGESFYHRVLRSELLRALMKNNSIVALNQDALHYYGSLLFSYSKNVFYYKNAFEHVRAGKDKFNMPFRATFKEVYSNMFILRLFDENFLTTLLQDITIKDIRIFAKHKEILEIFKHSFGKTISQRVKKKNDQLINHVYGPIQRIIYEYDSFLDKLITHLTDRDITHIKENLYSADFWLFQEFCDIFISKHIDMYQKYSDFSILGILATVRDTLFGFLLYMTFINQQQSKKNAKNISSDLLIKLYLHDVVNISEQYSPLIADILQQLITKHHQLLTVWLELDDNKQFFTIALENWISFTENKTPEQIQSEIYGEDMIWRRGFLKTITYYNKRYLIPKE